MTRPSRQFGLTLVELIVAITLTTLVVSSTAAILQVTQGARRSADTQADLQQEARTAMDSIIAALRNAYRTDANELLLEGLRDDYSDLPCDRIRFYTVSDRPVRLGQKESDVRECEFFVSPQRDELPALIRRLDPTRNDPPDGGGVIQRIAGGVVTLRFSYFDGLLWQDRWEESAHAWPLAIRVQVTVASQTPPRKSLTLSRLVNFPYWPQEPAPGAGATSQPAGAANAPAGPAAGGGPAR